MTEEQGEAVPARKVLAKGDFRFACVSCQADAVIVAAGTFQIANRLIGAIGWRIFMRDERGGATGLHCAKCAEGRQVASALPATEAAGWPQ